MVFRANMKYFESSFGEKINRILHLHQNTLSLSLLLTISISMGKMGGDEEFLGKMRDFISRRV